MLNALTDSGVTSTASFQGNHIKTTKEPRLISKASVLEPQSKTKTELFQTHIQTTWMHINDAKIKQDGDGKITTLQSIT